MSRRKGRIAISRLEADRWARRGGERAIDGDLLPEEVQLASLENLGLYRWDPDAWDAHVEVIQPYYIWVYRAAYDFSDLDPDVAAATYEYAPAFITVGLTPKSGGSPSIIRGDVDVELWRDKMDLMENMRPARPSELAKKMDPLELLGLEL